MTTKTLAAGIAIFVAGATFTSLAAAVTIVGGKSCGEWLTYRQEGGWPKTVVQNWVMGYLSGTAVASKKDFLEHADGDSAFLWIDQYCTKVPLERLDRAADALAIELRKRK